jgi:endonuclease/exonuclease/phosphatase (EEP) superfamily protein YafD
VLTHFAPAYLLAAAVFCGLSPFAARGVRWAVFAIALTSGVFAVALLLPEALAGHSARQIPARTGATIKIVQFNSWGKNAEAATAAAWLIRQDADFIVLQEPGKLRDRLRRAGYSPSCLRCGAIVFSRLRPISKFEGPAATGKSPLISGLVVKDEHGEFSVLSVHRYWPVRFDETKTQSEEIRSIIEARDHDRLIVAGDFNSTPWSYARRREDKEWGLIRRTIALPTWPAARLSHNRLPAPFPYLPIDHVYAGPDWATVSVERGPALGSDHYPVVVTLAPVNRPPT